MKNEQEKRHGSCPLRKVNEKHDNLGKLIEAAQPSKLHVQFSRHYFLSTLPEALASKLSNNETHVAQLRVIS